MGEGIDLSILHYTREDGSDPYDEWLRGLRDPKGKKAVIRKVNRLVEGILGDHKPIQGDVWELRIHVGPGYRVYYARVGAAIVLLLGGGDKGTQSGDIDRALARWKDWQRRCPG